MSRDVGITRTWKGQEPKGDGKGKGEGLGEQSRGVIGPLTHCAVLTRKKDESRLTSLSAKGAGLSERARRAGGLGEGVGAERSNTFKNHSIYVPQNEGSQ
jgi:hypothetical protein